MANWFDPNDILRKQAEELNTKHQQIRESQQKAMQFLVECGKTLRRGLDNIAYQIVQGPYVVQECFSQTKQVTIGDEYPIFDYHTQIIDLNLVLEYLENNYYTNFKSLDCDWYVSPTPAIKNTNDRDVTSARRRYDRWFIKCSSTFNVEKQYLESLEIRGYIPRDSDYPATSNYSYNLNEAQVNLEETAIKWYKYSGIKKFLYQESQWYVKTRDEKLLLIK